MESYPLRGTIQTGIQTSDLLFEWEAAHAANLDLSRWDSGEYEQGFRERVIAWYTRHIELEQHREDAKAKAIERKMKK